MTSFRSVATAAFLSFLMVLAGHPGWSSSANCLAWRQVWAPVAGDSSRLGSLSALSPTDIWAVGHDGLSPVIEHYDGSRWRVVPSPRRFAYLYGVKAFAADDVWAVGEYGGAGVLVEHWDGVRWLEVEAPQPGDYSKLLAIDGTSASDIWAVGNYTAPDGIKGLAEHYDGNSWSVVPMDNVSPDANVIQGVVTIAPDDIWAVGYQQISFSVNQPLAQHWDGTAWTAVPIDPPPSGDHNVFEDVSASSSADVWAIGHYEGSYPLMEHWDGTAWRRYSAPGQNLAIGVAVISPSDAWSGGTGATRPASWHWNGDSWSYASAPRVGSLSLIEDLEAISDRDIWAVGNYNPPQGGGQRPLVLHSKGVCR